MLPGASPEEPVTWLPVGLASGVFALAISRGSVFAPLRARARGWAAEFLGCWLCLSAWASLALTALQGAPAGVYPIVAWGASWAVACLFAGTVGRLVADD